MGHFEIDLVIGGGFMERLYVKPEKGEPLNLKELFPEELDIKKWFIREAR